MALVSPGLTRLNQKPVHKCTVAWRQLWHKALFAALQRHGNYWGQSGHAEPV
jgi:hypothetical protein